MRLDADVQPVARRRRGRVLNPGQLVEDERDDADEDQDRDDCPDDLDRPVGLIGQPLGASPRNQGIEARVDQRRLFGHAGQFTGAGNLVVVEIESGAHLHLLYT